MLVWGKNITTEVVARWCSVKKVFLEISKSTFSYRTPPVEVFWRYYSNIHWQRKVRIYIVEWTLLKLVFAYIFLVAFCISILWSLQDKLCGKRLLKQISLFLMFLQGIYLYIKCNNPISSKWDYSCGKAESFPQFNCIFLREPWGKY